jgi:glycosyltransferase involved in cell wall biosynthesis
MKNTERVRRLLVVTNTLRGGSGSHIVRLLDKLTPERWEVKVLCHGTRDFDPPAHVSLIDDTTRGRLHRFPVAQWRQLRRMHRLVQEYQPDIVHAFFFWPIIYGRILKRLGIVGHLVENREDGGFMWSETDYRVLRSTAGIPDRIICVSEAVREVVLEREGPPAGRTKVIRNGVALPLATLPLEERRAVRAELGFASSHRIVGMVANLDHAVKGASFFVESIPLIMKSVPEARFLVLGEGGGRAGLQRLAHDLGVADSVVFAGFRSDMHRFYPIMDVSVLTSLSEGLSMTILESMSYGLPVVATRVGGNPELVRDGRSGFLVPPRDPLIFADAVARVLKDAHLREEFGKQGLKIVEQEFALHAVAARYEEVYWATIAGAAPSRNETLHTAAEARGPSLDPK